MRDCLEIHPEIGLSHADAESLVCWLLFERNDLRKRAEALRKKLDSWGWPEEEREAGTVGVLERRADEFDRLAGRMRQLAAYLQAWRGAGGSDPQICQQLSLLEQQR